MLSTISFTVECVHLSYSYSSKRTEQIDRPHWHAIPGRFFEYFETSATFSFETSRKLNHTLAELHRDVYCLVTGHLPQDTIFHIP